MKNVKQEKNLYKAPEMSVLAIHMQDILTVSGENELEADVNK